MNRRLRIIPIPRKEPDLRLLAKALIALVEEQRQQQTAAKTKKPSQARGKRHG